jgi:hypothetical protein
VTIHSSIVRSDSKWAKPYLILNYEANTFKSILHAALRMYSPVILDPKDILQADASVIAGFLVLLTILFVFTAEEVSDTRMKWVRSKISVLAIIVIGLFSISALLIVLGDGMLFDFGKTLTVFGFGALVVGITYLLLHVRKYWGLKKEQNDK